MCSNNKKLVKDFRSGRLVRDLTAKKRVQRLSTTTRTHNEREKRAGVCRSPHLEEKTPLHGGGIYRPAAGKKGIFFFSVCQANTVVNKKKKTHTPFDYNRQSRREKKKSFVYNHNKGQHEQVEDVRPRWCVDLLPSR